jgi:salicylate hydroxylase
MSNQLKIAIIGAGVAGACIAVSLQEDPRYNVTIYEGVEVFREEGGQNTNLHPEGQRNMELLHPSILQALMEAGATAYDGWEFLIGSGPSADSIIFRSSFPKTKYAARGVKRNRFVAEVRKLLREGIIVMGKKLLAIEETTQTPKYKLSFTDGTIAMVDAVIGCDGYDSFTRQWVYGDDPDARGHMVDGVAFRHLMSRSEAIEAFGPEICRGGVYGRGYVCDGMFLLVDWSENGQSMQLVTEWYKYPGGWPFGDNCMWHEWDKETLKKDMAEVSLGPFGQKALAYWLTLPKIYASTRRIHAPARTAYKGAVCLVGDALQSLQPYDGNGTTTALYDALAVVTLLKTVKTASDIPVALEIYDSWRRPLRQATAKDANESAVNYNGFCEAGVDLKKWQERLPFGIAPFADQERTDEQ